MASTESSGSMSDSKASEDQNCLFEIDLNEIPSPNSSDDVVDPFQEAYELVRSYIGNPQPPPEPAAELPRKLGNKSCVCGKRRARDSVVICDGCESWFHLSCVGMSLQQADGLPEWMCRICVRDGVGSKRWPLGFVGSRGSKRKAELLGITGLPWIDGKGEATDAFQYQYQRNGFDLQRQCSMMPPFKSCTEGLIHNSLTTTRSFEDADLISHPGGTLRIRNANTQLKIKELARLPKANSSTWKQEICRSTCGWSSEMSMQPGTCSVGTIGKIPGSSGTGSRQLNSMLPVSHENFSVLQLGEVDLRPSYHTATQIWPVGYQSSWHDKVTGSIFTCDVLDGGDTGPIFKVTRSPCSISLTTSGSTILAPATDQLQANRKVENDNSVAPNIGYDADDAIQIHLSNPDPWRQDLISSRGSDLKEAFKGSCLLSTSSSISDRKAEVLFESVGSRDEIGVFCVEGRSPFLVWDQVSEKFVGACSKIFRKSGSLRFYCKHESCKVDSDFVNTNSNGTLGPLMKFCSSFDSLNIPHIIVSVNELDISCKALSKWLKLDRFGLDLDFVQKLVEQLLGAHSCSSCEFRNKGGWYSTLQTSGTYLMGKRNSGVQGEEAATLDNLFKGCKKARKQGFDQTHGTEVHCRPPGKPLSTKLSAEIAMDILQVWEFLWRFCEVLGIRESLSFEELENELINPWSDGTNFLEIKTQDRKIFNSHGNNDMTDLSTPPNDETNAAVNGENFPTFLTKETGSAKEASQTRLESYAYLERTGVSLTQVHSSLLNVLVGELQDKVAPLVDLNSDTGESKPRRGRKKDIDNLSPVGNIRIDMLPINELTWPELARRYILAVLRLDCNLESSEVISREGGYVFRCLQGDGGVLCGSLTGVAGMEADALLLAEATKQICGSLQREDTIGLIVEAKDTKAIGAWDVVGANGSSIPEWALLLEPVKKLPTNVGSRIRNCVYRALDKDPPEWARKILEHSISKEVYKGNAAGPTKRAVLSVLADLSREGSRQKSIKGRNGKGVKTVADIITEQCRSVLRCSVAADKSRTFCNLLGTSLNHNDDNDEGILGSPAMISRPLDFRTIDLRLAVGYYGGSHEAFVEDVREVWRTIRTVYGDSPELIQLAETLSWNFESLYENEVLTLVKRCSELADKGSLSEEVKEELNKFFNRWSGNPKAPWDEGVCKVCGIDKDDESVLLCDTCDAEYHRYCLVPPLARIPQGNWYCPSCVAVKGKSQNASRRTKLITRRWQKKYQGEDSRSFSEALNRLAVAMGEKEYWELSVEERIFLIKFLCDEVLNSTIIREHLDRCGEMSSDLQQKLRSLSLELRNLKLKERTSATRSTKDNLITFDGVLEVEKDKITTVLANNSSILQKLTHDDKFSNQMTPTGNVLQIQDVSEENRDPYKNCNGGRPEYVKVALTGNEITDETTVTDVSPIPENLSFHAFPIKHESNGKIDGSLSTKEEKIDDYSRVPNIQDCVSVSPIFHAQTNDPSMPHEVQHSCLLVESRQADIIANVTFTPMNLDNLCPNNDSNTQSDVNELEAPDLEANSIKNEVSLLIESIASIESQLLKVPLRREFLGRDYSGRLYWGLGRPENCLLLVVDESMPAQQKWGGNEQNDFLVGSSVPRHSIPFHTDTSSASRESAAFGSDGNGPFNYSSCGVTFSPSCVFYDCNADIKALIEWLRESDPREGDLRESILQFCMLRSQSTQQVGNRVHAESQPKPSDIKVMMAPKSLFTKAAAILEKNYGPCFEPETSEIPRNNVTYDDRLYRCECLEPIWPSRQHCISCHQTFCTSIEVEEHNDGRCKSGLPVLDESKEYDKPSKEKFMMKPETTPWCKNEMEMVEVLRSGQFDINSKLINFQKEEMGCTYKIEMGGRKFISEDSNKELVKEIELLGSNSFLSYVPYQSPSLHDSTLILDPTDKVEVEATVVPISLEVNSSRGKLMADQYHNQISNCSPRRSASIRVKEASSDKVPKADSLISKGPLSFLPSERHVSESGLVPLSAMRRLVGKTSQILRMIKINLLDMEAVLPEEAFSPAKAHPSNRRAWRAFIKSADSVLKMVKAIIVFENMIKTVHLKNGWWYWSSLSAAARTSTMSSLALRVYALDAAIIYERTSLGLNGNHTPDNLRSGRKRKEQGKVDLGSGKSRGLEDILPKSGEEERERAVDIGKDIHHTFLGETHENTI